MRRSKSLAQLERDAALRRVSRARRWMIIGAGGLSAAFAALVSAVAPGHSLGAKTHAEVASTGSARTAKASTAAASTASAPRMPPLASASELGLQGPSQDPQASSDPSQSQAQAPPSQPTQPAPAAQNPTPVAPSTAPAVVSGGS
jgi:hypothetical protein